jgi:hypothetical protein
MTIKIEYDPDSRVPDMIIRTQYFTDVVTLARELRRRRVLRLEKLKNETTPNDPFREDLVFFDELEPKYQEGYIAVAQDMLDLLAGKEFEA